MTARRSWLVLLAALLVAVAIGSVAAFRVYTQYQSRIAAGCGSTELHDSDPVERAELWAMQADLAKDVSPNQRSRWLSTDIAGQTALVRRDGPSTLPKAGEVQGLLAHWKRVYMQFHTSDPNPIVSVAIENENGDVDSRILSEQCPGRP